MNNKKFWKVCKVFLIFLLIVFGVGVLVVIFGGLIGTLIGLFIR